MARNEADREDLVRDATAYDLRGELRLPETGGVLFFGRKKRGGCSYYFDQDPVYHWTDQHQLRRAFIEGKLYRTQGTTLAQLARVRTETTSELIRTDLNPAELTEMFNAIRERLEKLQNQLQTGPLVYLQGNVSQAEFLPEISRATERILQQNEWLAPRIPGKR